MPKKWLYFINGVWMEGYAMMKLFILCLAIYTLTICGLTSIVLSLVFLGTSGLSFEFFTFLTGGVILFFTARYLNEVWFGMDAHEGETCPECKGKNTEFFLKNFISCRVYYWCHDCLRAFCILDPYEWYGLR